VGSVATLRRAVPLWRSDYVFDPIGMQCMTYGLSFWIPYHGTGTVAHTADGYYGKGIPEVDPYVFWSNAFLSINSGLDVRQVDADYETLRRLFGQWKHLAPNFLGDYYPLTPYSQEDWMVWQFHRPEAKQGMVQAFHREVGIYEAVRLQLRSLKRETSYLLESMESGEKTTKTGLELMRDGLVIPSPGRPGVAVITYRAQ
jgi:alpha-galactosidase